MVRAQLAREDTLVVAARDKEEAALLGLAVFTMESRSASLGQQLSSTVCKSKYQGGFDGRGQPTASPMLTAIMSGGVGISGRELYKYR